MNPPSTVQRRAAAATRGAPHGSTGRGLAGRLAGAAIIFALVLLAYAPVFHAGFIWDDQENIITNGTVPATDGLWQIWFVPRATQQYYPLMYTTYWVEYRLWGYAPAGYHVVNLLLHISAALLVWRLLERLHVPGAWLAAAIFAVHPVAVESVAWVTERKNVLSLSLAMLTVLAYLRYDPLHDTADTATLRPTRWPWYAAALVLFALALSAKTVVVTLPPVLLVLAWWQRGRITRHDVLATAPLFVLAVVSGLVTIWMETYHLRAQGNAWALSPVERILLAGRAVWFYAGKLAWPHPLVFFYPHFEIDSRAAWQYAFPILAVTTPIALWLGRHCMGRGPLAAVLIYAGVMVPMLGFFNIFYMLYAHVSDHFQYHASVALISLATAGGTLAARRAGTHYRVQFAAIAAGLLVLFTVLSYRESSIYSDLETLYRDTITKNPASVVAHSNLGVLLNEQGRYDEAIELLDRAVTLDDHDPVAHANLAYFRLNRGNRRELQLGEMSDIIAHLERALALSPESSGDVPDEAKLREQLAGLRLRRGSMQGFPPGDLDAAIADAAAAVRLAPEQAGARVTLGYALLTAGQLQEAANNFAHVFLIDEQRYAETIVQLQQLLARDAHSPDVHYALAGALAAQGSLPQAIDRYEQAIAQRPGYDRALNNLGVVLMNLGRTQEAQRRFEEAVRANPDYAEARDNLAKARQMNSVEVEPK